VSDRLPSDAVDSHRTHVERVGSTSRPRVPLPAAVDVTVGDVVRLSLEGERYHTQVSDALDGSPDIRDAFANARLARTPGEGDDHMRAWIDSVGLSIGDAVLVDVVTPGYKLGLRRPGERVIYEATDPPTGSLSDIARNLDG